MHQPREFRVILQHEGQSAPLLGREGGHHQFAARQPDRQKVLLAPQNRFVLTRRPMTSIEVFRTAWGAMQRIQQPFISPSLD